MEQKSETYKIEVALIVQGDEDEAELVTQFTLTDTLPPDLVEQHKAHCEIAGSLIRARLERKPNQKKLFDTISDESNALMRYTLVSSDSHDPGEEMTDTNSPGGCDCYCSGCSQGWHCRNCKE